MAQPQEVPSMLTSLAKERKDVDFLPVDGLPGMFIHIIRENPTSAIFRVQAGTAERLHHHTNAYELVVIKGKKTVWNLTKGTEYEDLSTGDYLFTPAGDRHRAKYHEDTEFFIKWDGHWDILFDEDQTAAIAATDAAEEIDELKENK